MRSTLLFNDDWLYLPEAVDDKTPDTAFTPVTLPHSNVTLPHHNFDDLVYQFISTYRKRFRLPEARAGRRVLLEFDGALLATTVTINGHTFPEHRGGFTPFSFDITDFIHDEAENLLTIHLDSSERPDIPPFGYTVDYLTFGGMYRDVWLLLVDTVYIENLFVRTYDVLSDRARVEVDVCIHNTTGAAVQCQLDVNINSGVIEADGTVATLAAAQSAIDLPANQQTTAAVTLENITDFNLWTLDNPARHGLAVSIQQPDGTVDDYGAIPFGFREAVFREDGFYLNGEKVALFGLNRHQTYPYIGAAAPARLQARDADIIKYELGCNIVRTSHYPQSPHFLHRCDEIGLLVMEEIPGWQHIGDRDWQALSLRDVRAMIERDRNHPSIVLWGVRINESGDHGDFYLATNQLARQLDPTRQTTGVRYWQESEFLEDVYGFNDFSNDIEEPAQTPHLVTEFSGHMFPTKTWDNEERRIEHALRHARIQSRQMGMGGVAGAIGWCAFDYHTHKEFGSGDRVCYHGVMDMFRLPKLAAYFYASQQSPDQRIVLHAATHWRLGDVNGGQIEPLYVFSNCDSLDTYVGDRRIGRFAPDADQFPHLPHPPFVVTGLGVSLAQRYGDLRIVGYRDGRAVAEQILPNDPLPHVLLLAADDTQLHADGSDMTRISFKIVDRCGNVLPYAHSVVTFAIMGDAEIIGENPFPLVGGQASLFIRAGRTPGLITLTAHAAQLPPASVQIEIISSTV